MLLIIQDLGFLPKAKSVVKSWFPPENVEILVNMNEIDNASPLLAEVNVACNE